MQSLTKIRRRLTGWKHVGTPIERLDLRSAVAFSSSWRDTIFDEVRFDLGDFRQSEFDNCYIDKCHGDQANFLGCRISRTEFRRGSYEQASFIGAVLTDVHFSGVRLSYSSFAGAILRGRVMFTNCNLHGADLDFLESEKPTFLGCNLWGAKIPFGCSFFNGSFDDETVDRFVAMAARMHPNAVKANALRELAGHQAPLVERLMGEAE